MINLFLDSPCLHLRSNGWSEPTTNASPEQTAYIIIPKMPKNRVPLLRKKKWHQVALDNNNKRDETIVLSQLTTCKTNTMTDSYILLVLG